MLAIKFKRVGKKHQASFRVVVMEKKSKLRGRFIEDLGFYNPHTKNSEISGERTLYWIKNGAQPTDTVHNFLVSKEVIKEKKRPVHVKIKKGEEAGAAKSEEEVKSGE